MIDCAQPMRPMCLDMAPPAGDAAAEQRCQQDIAAYQQRIKGYAQCLRKTADALERQAENLRRRADDEAEGQDR